MADAKGSLPVLMECEDEFLTESNSKLHAEDLNKIESGPVTILALDAS